MRIKIQQFLLGDQHAHSWAIVGRNIADTLINHLNFSEENLDLVPTDGVGIYDKLPPGITKFFKYVKPATGQYDCQISFTAPHNFQRYLSYGTRNRFGIWAWEFFPYIPKEFVKHHQFVDQILVPTNFCRNAFITSGTPENKVSVLPHGVHIENFTDKTKYPLKTKKSIKFLMVVGQPHLRKNISNSIEAFYKAFTNEDDVCLVAKIVIKDRRTQPFEVDVRSIITELNKKYPQHPEIELITEFIPNIYHLHNACQIYYSLTKGEGFLIPALDAHFAGQLVIVPKHGGQLDFCNFNNSLLIDGKIVRAPLVMQYYGGDIRNSCFESDLDSAVATLRQAASSYQDLIPKFSANFEQEKPKYIWSNIVDNIINMCV
jgi:glycosyltransferase involved in cell wall biosynthesis